MPPVTSLRPRVSGKFLWLGDEKFFVRGVTYGAFAPNADGHQFPEAPQVAHDFALMREAGINSLLTYTVPPRSLLDQAQEHGLRVINIPWMGRVCFLEQASTRRDARLAVQKAVASCREHPAVLMYAVAGAAAQIIRWHGIAKLLIVVALVFLNGFFVVANLHWSKSATAKSRRWPIKA